DQGKRLLLAVGLALAFMLVWNKFWGPKDDDKKPDAGSAAGSAIVAGPVAPGSPVGQSIEPMTPSAGTSMVEAPRGPVQKIVMPFAGKFTATFSSYGGALVSFKLADPRY